MWSLTPSVKSTREATASSVAQCSERPRAEGTRSAPATSVREGGGVPGRSAVLAAARTAHQWSISVSVGGTESGVIIMLRTLNRSVAGRSGVFGDGLRRFR